MVTRQEVSSNKARVFVKFRGVVWREVTNIFPLYKTWTIDLVSNFHISTATDKLQHTAVALMERRL